MATSSTERMLCLAMTVLGPLTVETSPGDNQQSCGGCRGSSDGGLRSLLGRSVCSIFSSLEWKTLKTMTALFGSVERCLQSLSRILPISDEDIPRLEAGARLIKEWETENDKMTDDLEKLQKELETTRAKCRELVTENAGLRQKCDAYSEAGIILEQDRQQLQSLLSDKCKLLEENQHLEREISSLQELLEYATEHAVDEEEVFDGEVGVDCDDSDDGEFSEDDLETRKTYSPAMSSEDE